MQVLSWNKITSFSILFARTSFEKDIDSRYGMVMTPIHFLTNIANPCFKGESLSTDKTGKVMNFAAEVYPGLIPIIIRLNCFHFPTICLMLLM